MKRHFVVLTLWCCLYSVVALAVLNGHGAPTHDIAVNEAFWQSIE